MPLTRLPLIGEEYSARSIASSGAALINLYPELIDGVLARGPLSPAQAAKNVGALYGTPGRTTFAALGHTDTRAMWAGGGRVFVVNGTDLVELSSAGAEITRRGTLVDDGKPAQIFSNGNQLLIVSGGLVYCDSGAGPVAQSFPASTGTVTAGSYGRVTTDGTVNVVWDSGNKFPTDGSWNGLTISLNPGTFTISSVLDDEHLALTATATADVNGSYVVGDKRVFLVGGDGFLTSGVWIGRNIVINGSTKVIASVVDSGELILTTTPTTSAPFAVSYSVAGDAITAVGAAFLDGYFIIQRPRGGSPDLGRQFNISALNNGASWDALDFATKESYPDYIQQILSANEQLYIFGEESFEAWQNTGGTVDDPFPFQRINGSVSRFGAVSAWSQVALDGNVYFLGGDNNGYTRAYVLNGFTPVPISTPAQENAWLTTPAFGRDVIAYAYTEEGHSFAVFASLLTGGTFAFDQNTGCWHQRNKWSGSAFTYNDLEFHCFVFKNDGSWGNGGKHLVASRSSGTVYVSDLNVFNQDGTDTAAQGTFPYIYKDNKKLLFGRFTLEMQTGTVPSGAAPNVTLNWSDDRGATFNTGYTMGAGTAGQTNIRMYVNRTGGLTGSGGMTRGRVFRLTFVGKYKIAVIDASSDVEVCGE